MNKSYALAAALTAAVFSFVTLPAAQATEADVSLPQIAATESVVNQGWLEFEWGTSGNAFPSFSFTTKTAVRLTITDVSCKGDAFAIYDRGVLIRTTPTVAIGDCPGEGDINDPNVALRDPAYSHASFVLRPGTHEITVKVVVNPHDEGGAANIRFDAPPRRP